jgi:hypothetical protein
MVYERPPEIQEGSRLNGIQVDMIIDEDEQLGIQK